MVIRRKASTVRNFQGVGQVTRGHLQDVGTISLWRWAAHGPFWLQGWPPWGHLSPSWDDLYYAPFSETSSS